MPCRSRYFPGLRRRDRVLLGVDVRSMALRGVPGSPPRVLGCCRALLCAAGGASVLLDIAGRLWALAGASGGVLGLQGGPECPCMFPAVSGPIPGPCALLGVPRV